MGPDVPHVVYNASSVREHLESCSVPPLDSEPLSILTPDIGYDLRYRGGKVRLKSLLSSRLFTHTHLRVYAGCRFLSQDPERQGEFLREICESVTENRLFTDSVRLFHEYTKGLDPESEVEATKFNFVNRIGPILYAERWLTMAEDVLASNCTPILQAYSSLLGLPQFAELLPVGRSLGVVIENPSTEKFKLRGFLLTKNETGWTVQQFNEFSNLIDLLADHPPVLVVHTKNDSTKFERISQAFSLAPGLAPFREFEFFDLLPPHQDSAKLVQLGDMTITPRGFLREVAWRIGQLFGNRRGKSLSRDADSFFILPEGIRYELQYNSGEVKADTLRKTRSPQLLDSIIYLSAKLLQKDTTVQSQFLHDCANLILADSLTGEPHFPSLSHIHDAIGKAFNDANIAPDESVKAGKLSLVSRIGPTLFAKCWHDAILRIKGMNEVPCLVGYAGLTGFSTAVRHTEEGAGFLIFVPDTDTPEKSFGYYLRREGDKFSIQIFDGNSDLDSIIGSEVNVGVIDDAVKSGNTLRFIHQFFKAREKFPRPSGLYYIDRTN